VLVLGDYNTMEKQDAPPVSAQQELAVFDGELAPGFRRLAMTPNCTEYFEGKAGALDHTYCCQHQHAGSGGHCPRHRLLRRGLMRDHRRCYAGSG
jgi:hypothetical protein